MRRFFVSAAILALGVGTAVAAAPTEAGSPHGVGCQIAGTAKLSPGLSTAVKSTKYTFVGTLTNCHGSDSKLAKGTVTAKGAGKVSCAGGSTAGVATIRWNTGKTTSIKLTTNGLANADNVQFTVTKSTESALKKGDQGDSGLAFTSFTGSCTDKKGVTAAKFNGLTGAGAFS
jgi:hypothetical protein